MRRASISCFRAVNRDGNPLHLVEDYPLRQPGHETRWIGFSSGPGDIIVKADIVIALELPTQRPEWSCRTGEGP